MTIVPFELKHLELLDMNKTNHLARPITMTNVNKHFILCGKTFFDKDEIIGIGIVSLIGKIAVGSLMVTDRLRCAPLFFIKSIKQFMSETANEGYTIIAAAQSEVENKFMVYLGFKEPVKFNNNGNQLTRYRYETGNIS